MINKIDMGISYETESWIRTLHFLRAENNMRITSLNTIILSSSNAYKMEKLEFFLELFINQFNMLKLLEIEIHFFNQSIHPKMKYLGIEHVISEEKKLHSGMKNAVKAFHQLHEHFQSFF
jgi:hypothetical protein